MKMISTHSFDGSCSISLSCQWITLQLIPYLYNMACSCMYFTKRDVDWFTFVFSYAGNAWINVPNICNYKRGLCLMPIQMWTVIIHGTKKGVSLFAVVDSSLPLPSTSGVSWERRCLVGSRTSTVRLSVSPFLVKGHVWNHGRRRVWVWGCGATRYHCGATRYRLLFLPTGWVQRQIWLSVLQWWG